MISKPPSLGGLSPEEWIKSFLSYFQSVQAELAVVKTIFIPAQGNDVNGTYAAEQVTSGNSAYISMVVPRLTSEIREVVFRFIPTTTGTIDYTFNASYGGKDEDESAGTATLTADGLAVTDDRIMEIDITSLFAAVDADDQVGIQFVLDAVATTTNVYALGVYFKYR